MREPALTPRMRPFTSTIFAEMSALAVRTNSINLGQGFPDTDGPVEVLDAAVRAIRGGQNQYPPGLGIPQLRAAIAAHQERFYGLRYDPDTEVLVTAGATEAIAAALLALCVPGDEVVTLDPSYDSYAAGIALAGAVHRGVPLRAPTGTGGYTLDPADLRAVIGPRTRVVLLNSPHNPTGTVLTPADLAAVAEVCQQHDVVVITDEVYEHLTFDGRPHVPLATLPGLRDRTLVVSSAGKTFSVTGWKIGWVCGPAHLVAAVRAVKQFLTYVNGAPFQPAVALGLGLPDAVYDGIAATLQAKRDRLTAGLVAAGLTVHPSQGTYFVTVDVASIGVSDGLAFCRDLPRRAGVVAVPSSVFYADPAAGASLVRFAFCKADAVLDEAVRRLSSMGT